MSTLAAAAPAVSGPAEERYSFLKRTAAWTLAGLLLSGAVGTASTIAIAPYALRYGQFGYGGVVLVTFFIAHWLCRRMVYGGAKIPGFLLACAAEGTALGCLLLVTIARFGGHRGLGLVVEALGLTAACAVGMLVYAWFSKGELRLVRAFISMASLPLLILMIVTAFFPIGGVLGVVVTGAFVATSAGALLYRLHYVVNELDTDAHIEGAYEITMGVLVLLWNILVLLNKLRR